MRWLTTEMVEAIHQESIVRFGGRDGLRDHGLLDSAVHRPRNIQGFEPNADIYQLAAAYCVGIIRNHPFVDGNKRAGILSAAAFLALNGQRLQFEEVEIVTVIEGLAAGNIDEAQISEWLRRSNR